MATNCRKQRRVIRTVIQRRAVERRGLAYLLSTHEAVLLLDVDVVNCGSLFSPRLVTDDSIGTSHHATLTTSHLQDQTPLTTRSGENCSQPQQELKAQVLAEGPYLRDFVWSSKFIN